MNLNKLKLKLEKRLKQMSLEYKMIKDILKDIENTNSPRCNFCNVSNLRINKDGSCFCKSCGRWSNLKENKNEN